MLACMMLVMMHNQAQVSLPYTCCSILLEREVVGAASCMHLLTSWPDKHLALAASADPTATWVLGWRTRSMP
jgi:hypothetical protein